MHFLYILTAIMLGIGVSHFAGPDTDQKLIQQANQRRAETMEYQSKMFARRMRREIIMDGTQFSRRAGDETPVPKAIHDKVEYAGYRMQGRYAYTLRSDGSLVAHLTDAAKKGPGGLGEEADVVAAKILAPQPELRVGRVDLDKEGVPER